MTNAQRLEQCLGETVVYMGDQLDLRIRQGDKEAAMKLSMLQEAWRLSVKLLNQST